jgi:L-malate glycosyltransferase
MKIAIVYDMLYPYCIGGIELRNYEIAKRLAKNHEVHLFGIKLWNGKSNFKKQGIYYHGIYRYKKKYSFKGYRSILEPMGYSLKLLTELFKYNFDLVECSAFPYFPALATKLYCSIKNKPLFITWHGYWHNYWYEYLGVKGFFGKVIEKVTTHLTLNTIVVSNHVLTSIKNNNHFLRQRNYKIIFNGVNLKKIESIGKQHKKYDIIYVGRIVDQKNIPLLIKALSILKRDIPEAKILMVGDGPDRRSIEQIIKKEGLNKNIELVGFQSLNTVYQLMKESKVLVLPSKLEGFGIVIIEAYACGIPVVTVHNKLNAATEFVMHNKTGLIAENNPSSLANNIKNLLNNESLRKIMAKNAKKYVKNFEWSKITKDLENEFNKNG